MISQHTFNKTIEQINAEFSRLRKEIQELKEAVKPIDEDKPVRTTKRA